MTKQSIKTVSSSSLPTCPKCGDILLLFDKHECKTTTNQSPTNPVEELLSQDWKKQHIWVGVNGKCLCVCGLPLHSTLHLSTEKKPNKRDCDCRCHNQDINCVCEKESPCCDNPNSMVYIPPTEPMGDKWESCGYCKKLASNHNGNRGYRCKRHTQKITVTTRTLYTAEQLAKSVQEAKAERDKQWRSKLGDIFDCPYVVEPATCPNRDVSRAGEAPEQVVGTLHMSYVKYNLLTSLRKEIIKKEEKL